jgi:hypothetical protein
VTLAALAAVVVVGVGYTVQVRHDPSSLSDGPLTATSSVSPSTFPSDATPSAPPPVQSPGPTVTLTASPTPTVTPSQPVTPSPTPAAPVPTPTPLPPPTLDFTLSSFNVLGASHTAGRGKRPGMASGPVRAVRAAELIRRHGSDVVGFQELQSSQLTTLRRHTDLDFYPGFELGDPENSIGWRRDRFVAVEKHTVPIPYFNGGRRNMPFVKLRSLTTGLEAWFANFHNPAETAQYHHQQRYRDQATKIEVYLANQLITQTGLPVFVTGDMNERAAYFCRFTAGTPMVAARGGTHNGRCLAGQPRAVDWIFGSQGVEFLSYDEDRSDLVDITTDHPVITARVRIVGKPLAD